MLEAVKKIVQYLGWRFELIRHKKKIFIGFTKMDTMINLKMELLLIAFSRAEVLKKTKTAKKIPVSVIYGNLSPEVRRDEARRFRDGQTQILIATDAISMGLNLPIKTILLQLIQNLMVFQKEK